jgi:hypothetical protein
MLKDKFNFERSLDENLNRRAARGAKERQKTGEEKFSRYSCVGVELNRSRDPCLMAGSRKGSELPTMILRIVTVTTTTSSSTRALSSLWRSA